MSSKLDRLFGDYDCFGGDESISDDDRLQDLLESIVNYGFEAVNIVNEVGEYDLKGILEIIENKLSKVKPSEKMKYLDGISNVFMGMGNRFSSKNEKLMNSILEMCLDILAFAGQLRDYMRELSKIKESIIAKYMELESIVDDLDVSGNEIDTAKVDYLVFRVCSLISSFQKNFVRVIGLIDGGIIVNLNEYFKSIEYKDCKDREFLKDIVSKNMVKVYQVLSESVAGVWTDAASVEELLKAI